jgi:hypothetical protein
LQQRLIGSILSDPPIHGCHPRRVPWVGTGTATLDRHGRFEVRIRGLLVAGTNNTGPVTTVTASLYCAPDSSAAVFTTTAEPLSSDGDARIRRHVTVPVTVSGTRRAGAPERQRRRRTSWRPVRAASRQSDELVLDADELVALQRPDGFGVQRRERTRRVGNQPQRLRAPLPERAFERALLAQRLEAATARGQAAASGHSPQRGTRAMQTVAPRSISACAHVWSNARPCAPELGARSRPPAAPAARSAKQATAAAVYGPTPAARSGRRASRVRRRRAARCRLSARRL